MTTSKMYLAGSRCDRCYKETRVTIVSYFNTDTICVECKAKERAHPDYQKAVDAEVNAVKAGNLNFSGIGLPLDLR